MSMRDKLNFLAVTAANVERARIRKLLLEEIESLIHYVEWRGNRSQPIEEP